MESQSIADIGNILGPVEQGLEGFDTSAFKGVTFGEEGEYTAKSLIIGARALVTDLRGQIEKPGRFVKLTTAPERRAIVSNLAVLNNALQTQQLSSVANVLQELKVILRPFQFRGSPETREQLEAAVDDLHRNIEIIKEERRKIAAEQVKLEELSMAVSAKLDESGARLEVIKQTDSSLDELVSASAIKAEEVAELNRVATLSVAAVEASKVSASASKDIIEDFVRKISAREIQLTDQQTQSDAFTEVLNVHRAKMAEVEVEAQRVIESARTALSYRTAEGLSAAFIERYAETKDDPQRKLWLRAAAVLVLGAIALGIWITWDTKVTLAVVAGRVSLIPILIAGAWFCAHQYVKLANIAEEYAYKSVLSKSIVGFSEQMSKDNDAESDHSHYIRTVLAEIHTNPLRTQGKVSPVQEKVGEFEGAEKLLKLVAELQKAVK